MERFVLKDLISWKNNPHRKPLIIRGARQVGKTWILKEFGKLYPDGCAYFNFERNEEYRQFFKGTKEIKRILTIFQWRVDKKSPQIHLLFLMRYKPVKTP